MFSGMAEYTRYLANMDMAVHRKKVFSDLSCPPNADFVVAVFEVLCGSRSEVLELILTHGDLADLLVLIWTDRPNCFNAG